MGCISGMNVARKRSGRDVSTSTRTIATGSVGCAAQVCFTVKAGCTCVIVTAAALAWTLSASSASGTGFERLIDEHMQPEIAQRLDGENPCLEAAVLEAEQRRAPAVDGHILAGLCRLFDQGRRGRRPQRGP